MKWYFAIDEAGTKTKVGWHARLAVTSAAAVGGLEPVLLYDGKPNEFTAWMQARGVRVLERETQLLGAMRELDGRSPAYLNFRGHWLRADICRWDQDEAFVVYTDCDVVFLKRPDLAAVRPDFIACAPEFVPQEWSYFNSGVMVMNLPALRREHAQFRDFIAAQMRASTGSEFLDQNAYNEFYRGRWMRLDPRFNWKPYWGFGGDRLGELIVHFHGPKLPEVRRILAEKWPWDEPFGRLMGSMLLSALPGYLAYVERLLQVPALPEDVAQTLHDILKRAQRFDRARYRDKITMAWADGSPG